MRGVVILQFLQILINALVVFKAVTVFFIFFWELRITGIIDLMNNVCSFRFHSIIKHWRQVDSVRYLVPMLNSGRGSSFPPQSAAQSERVAFILRKSTLPFRPWYNF